MYWCHKRRLLPALAIRGRDVGTFERGALQRVEYDGRAAAIGRRKHHGSVQRNEFRKPCGGLGVKNILGIAMPVLHVEVVCRKKQAPFYTL